MKLLIIEDDQNILSLLENGLEEDGHIIDKADNGADGEYLACLNKYDVIVLDWMLPLKSGIDILKAIRLQNVNTPILMLTAKDQTQDKIKGLRSGCDDYLVKPFNFEELNARIEALHRRFNNNYTKEIIVLNDVIINKETKVILKNDEELTLSSKELSILFLLIQHKNSFVSKSMIEDMIYNAEQVVSSNVVSVTIHNLRKKIGNDIIKNFRGLGYKIEI